MQTRAHGEVPPRRPTRVRVDATGSRVRRMPVHAALNELAALRTREPAAFRLMVDLIDSALEASDVRWCGEFLDALDVESLSDDVALSPLIGTFIARAALPEARTRYVARVRPMLDRRGWTAQELAQAVDRLV